MVRTVTYILNITFSGGYMMTFFVTSPKVTFCQQTEPALVAVVSSLCLLQRTDGCQYSVLVRPPALRRSVEQQDRRSETSLVVDAHAHAQGRLQQADERQARTSTVPSEVESRQQQDHVHGRHRSPVPRGALPQQLSRFLSCSAVLFRRHH